MPIWLQYLPYIVLPMLVAIPLGRYIGHVINNEKTILSPVVKPIENTLYRVLHVSDREMSWREYLADVLAFSLMGFVVLFFILKFQNILPGNPEHFPGLSWHLAFNTAVSFVTGTNWQSYASEVALSNTSQALGLTVQNFVAASVGISVAFAVIRGFKRVRSQTIGNFWRDLTRVMLYILLPISFVMALFLVSRGVPQTTSGFKTAELTTPVAVDQHNHLIYGAEVSKDKKTVTLDGKTVKGAKVLTKEAIPLYPEASQTAIKLLGTNGGGVLKANSAHPFENPTPGTDVLEMSAMLYISMAMCFAFGYVTKRRMEGVAIFVAMALMFVFAMYTQAYILNQGTNLAGFGNLSMEGKETRFGVPATGAWSIITTATSSGAVNGAMDSLNALGGLFPLMLMQLGEVVFGGVGSGFYGMLGFILLTVFIAGLMVGRTPEYLGKKIGPYEMRMAVLACLATPVAILTMSTIPAILKSTLASFGNAGPHAFSELLYAFTSAGANNGSAFAGLNTNTPVLNVLLAIAMLIARFVPIAAMLAVAGHMSSRKVVARTSGTLTTASPTFVFMLILVILIVGVLSFFPALSLGPIADYLVH